MGLTPNQVFAQKKIMEREGVVSHETVVLGRLKAESEGEDKTFSYENGIGDVSTFKVFDPHRQTIKRSAKGRKGITRYGTKMVRNACHCLQTEYGKKRLGFGTLTLASTPHVDGEPRPELFPLLCESWSEIVRKTNQEIKRELERAGGVPETVGVTEIQTKRSKKVGFCVPHLHFVYVSWDGKRRDEKGRPVWYLPHVKIKEIFDRVCVNELARVTGFPAESLSVNNRVNVQAVKKSAEGYLGKYMSKGAEDVKKYLEEDPDRKDIPSHWWHCTKGLREVVKRLICPVPVSIVEGVLSNFTYLIKEKVIQYCQEITIEYNGVKRTVGYAFRVNKEYMPIGKTQISEAFNHTE